MSRHKTRRTKRSSGAKHALTPAQKAAARKHVEALKRLLKIK
jgi:hypothetical protein